MSMTLKNNLILILFSLLLFSCTDKYKFELMAPKKLNVTQELVISLRDKNSNPIDSVQFSLNGKKIKSTANFKASIVINDYKLGKHHVSALVFYANKTKKLTSTVYFLADKAPEVYDFKIINTYPHDKTAYTQGLEFHDGFLYESTGQKGNSSLRKVVLETGRVVQQINLEKEYFGEGMTKFGDEIFMLTWQKGLGFVFDFETFEQKRTFKYKNSIQGWGLTNDGKHLIKTDGTEQIWFLNAKNQVEEYHIEAYTNKRKVENLNELEYVNGKIYANVYQKNSILIVNPKSGKIEGVVNLNGLKIEMEKTQKLIQQDEVLNGIAYDNETKRLFVTGKRWSKLFEIELIKKE